MKNIIARYIVWQLNTIPVFKINEHFFTIFYYIWSLSRIKDLTLHSVIHLKSIETIDQANSSL